MPGEAARKRVAGPRGVLNVVQRVGGCAEDGVVGEQKRAVLALLDDERLGAHVADPGRGANQVGLVRQLASLGVVDDEAVDLREGRPEAVRGVLDPVVHRVGHHEFGIVHLVQHIALDARLQVAEAHDVAVEVALREVRLERSEDVELRVERVPLVHIVVVLAVPEERLAVLLDLKALKVDPPIGQRPAVLIGKVAPDDAHEADIFAKVAGGERQVGRTAPQHTFGGSERSIDGIKGNSPYGKDAHGRLSSFCTACEQGEM